MTVELSGIDLKTLGSVIARSVDFATEQRRLDFVKWALSNTQTDIHSRIEFYGSPYLVSCNIISYLARYGQVMVDFQRVEILSIYLDKFQEIYNDNLITEIRRRYNI